MNIIGNGEVPNNLRVTEEELKQWEYEANQNPTGCLHVSITVFRLRRMLREIRLLKQESQNSSKSCFDNNLFF